MKIAFYQIDAKQNLRIPMTCEDFEKSRDALRANLPPFMVHKFDAEMCEIVTSSTIDEVNTALASVI